MRKKILFFLLMLSGYAQAQYFLEGDRAFLDPLLAPFYHGVASGDPLADRVIIWTRVTTNASSVNVNWQMALDTAFSQVVQTGSFTTDASRDYTVKVDVTGLQPNTWYYYRFETGGIQSVTGRTKTAPVGSINNLRFAVLACSNYQSGYFNAYRDIVTKNEVDAVIHLGDYYYEYGADDFDPSTDSSRLHEPANEILNLSDYRIRNSFYRLDKDLRAIHQMFPFICVWDDHETANNSWMEGAENHTPGAEGNWSQRRDEARQAYFEWIPIRDVHNSVDTIHRTLPYGNLADLIMIDTRLEGRQEQLGVSGAAVTDPTRTLLGNTQREWFKNQLSTSTAQWKIIGNQVMVSPLKIAGTPVNEDQWDGYPAERENILTHIRDNNIDNTVFLTGDIHTSWANDIPVSLNGYTASTGAGSVAVEYVCTSVTSTSFITFAVPLSLIQTFNPNIKYADLAKRGYLLLDITPARVQGDWVHMSTVANRNFSSSVSASWQTNQGENHLVQSPGPIPPRTNNAVQPEEVVSGIAGPDRMLQTVSAHPNPFGAELRLQYYVYQAGEVTVSLVDINGWEVLKRSLRHAQSGLNNEIIPTKELIPGSYILSISSGKDRFTQTIQKVR